MTNRLDFGCLPTMIGSMPHTDPGEACNQVVRHLTHLPSWPQLVQRSFRESMYAQFSEGFPGVMIEGERIYIDRLQNVDSQLERLYNAYVANDVHQFPISSEYAAGLHNFLSFEIGASWGVKGQITGPVSWGLSVTDQDRRPILYDDVLSEAVAKFLRLKAAWQEIALSKLSSNTIVFIDEPYMSSIGSAYVSISPQQVHQSLEEVLNGISGIKGVHCCGNTDWPQLLDTSIDILSFDAYNHAQSLSFYQNEVQAFIDRGGAIAWGIIPNDEDILDKEKESVASLLDRLEEAIAPFTRKGTNFQQLLSQALLTPSCGLGYLSMDGAERALELLSGLSERLRSTRL